MKNINLTALILLCSVTFIFAFSLGKLSTKWEKNFIATVLSKKTAQSSGAIKTNSFKKPLQAIPQKIANYISFGKPVTGSRAEVVFWKTLRASPQYPNFEISLNDLQTETPLSADQVTKYFQMYFPRFAKTYTVLTPTEQGE